MDNTTSPKTTVATLSPLDPGIDVDRFSVKTEIRYQLTCRRCGQDAPAFDYMDAHGWADRHRCQMEPRR